MFTLAHLSDIHLSLPRHPRLTELWNQRLIGYVNILRRRGASHQDWALEALVEALKADRPDHVALTGDLINLAMRVEFRRARDWLQGHFTPEQLSLVPGNHDSYVAVSERRGLGLWRDYMRGDEEAPEEERNKAALRWPYVRRRGHVALVGVSTAIVSRPFLATGRVGPAQLVRLAEILADLGREGCCRVVMIHHPPAPTPTHWHKRLLDDVALAEIFEGAGAELVLHGHNHTDTLSFTPGPERPIPIVGVTSGSAIGMPPKPSAQYHLFRIAQDRNGWSIGQTARGLDPDSGEVSTLYERDRLSEEAV
ncbi:MAG TPA: metallophosphoesterase [Hyphomicrobiales bacterium]|nr:metallophosphoesterase [Hyphomicrobiales bacterium]